MNFRAKTRRTRFAMKAKPRSTRGISRKEGHKQLSLGYAAAGKRRRKTSRRVKPKRETPRAIHSERSGGEHKRVRLYGKAREARRAEVFERAGGRCEEIITVQRNVSWNRWHPYFVPTQERCPNRATEWSHRKHAANKCDCFSPDCSIASCHACHVKRHAGGNGKPCPKKEVVA